MADIPLNTFGQYPSAYNYKVTYDYLVEHFYIDRVLTRPRVRDADLGFEIKSPDLHVQVEVHQFNSLQFIKMSMYHRNLFVIFFFRTRFC